MSELDITHVIVHLSGNLQLLLISRLFRMHDVQWSKCVIEVIARRMQVLLRGRYPFVTQALLREQQISGFAPQVVGG